MKQENLQNKTRPVKYRKAVILPKVKLFNQVKWILQEKYNGKLTAKAKKDIERLKRGEPVDYIIGFVEFLGCKIDLSKKPLIPRVETEFWVEYATNNILTNSSLSGYRSYGRSSKIMVLDMFAGSGCIGIAVLKHIKNSQVVFVDNNKKFLEQIKINLKLNNINKKTSLHTQVYKDVFGRGSYKIVRSNIFSKFQSSQELKNKFDYIFANPPYIATKRKNKIQKSVLRYEPKEALFGGGDGLLYIKKFLADAKNFLNPSGKIYMEFDFAQKNKIEKVILKQEYSKYEFHKDQYGKWRDVEIFI